MLVLLPVVCLLLLWVIASVYCSDLRVSMLAGSLLWGTIVVILTEALSLFKVLTYTSLIISWGTILIIVTGILFYVHPHPGIVKTQHKWASPNFSSLIVSLFAIFMIEVFIAFLAPPNTWDSMTYHMSRVVHWIQNSTIAFYPTHILRQNHQAPFAEWAIMHLQILSQGDRFANMIQWFSMFGSVLGVSLIAQELGATRHVQLVTAVVCATIPMGILQASSTQNDYVVSFWLVCAIYFLIKTNRNHSYTSTNFIGAALGLSLLTKGTAYVYIFPFLLVEGAILVYRYPKKAAQSIILIGGIALLLNLGHYSRNVHLYGSPLGPGQESISQHRYANDVFSFSIMGSNIVRNAGLHLTTPFLSLNRVIERGIYLLLGDEMNNPASTWGGTSFHIKRSSLHEDVAGNPLHLLFIVISLGLILLSASSPWRQRCYVVCLLASSVLFCLYVRWQPWHSRLHLSLFVLFSPIVALGVSKILKTERSFSFFAMFLILASIPWLALNRSRPLLGPRNIVTSTRVQQYFANCPSLIQPYTEAVNALVKHDIRDIGLLCGGDDWEYPFHILLHLQQHYQHDFRIEHINVANISKELISSEFSPSAILVTKGFPEEIRGPTNGYMKLYGHDEIAVFKKLQEESFPGDESVERRVAEDANHELSFQNNVSR